MMDVDQPVSSTTDTEKEEPLSQENDAAKSLGDPIEQESDDLPALLISDSEEEEDDRPNPSRPPKASTKEMESGDISGITPIETTVVNVPDDTTVAGETVGSDVNGNETVQETSAVVEANNEDSAMENIDLTGASSADDSGATEEPSCATTTTPLAAPAAAATPKTPTKPSSEMTAQELLESLLGAQEEAFASHRASEVGAEPERTEEAAVESKPTEAVDKTDTASDAGKITHNKLDTSSSTVQQEDRKDVTGENGSNMDTVVIDDECLLEEMSNVPAERRQEMDIDERGSGSSRSSCSADGPNQISEGSSQQANDRVDEGEEKNDHDDDDDDDEDSNEEPPRKRARSMMNVVEDPTIETTESTFRANENDTVQTEPRSDELANKTAENSAKDQLDSTSDVTLLEDEPVSAADSPVPKSTTTPNDTCGSAQGGDQLKEKCVEVGGQLNVKPVEPSVCPDILVIDDDDDDDDNVAAADVACTSNVSQETDEKKQDPSAESELQTDLTGENTAKRTEVDSSVRISPVPLEKVERESIPMEFLRKFNRPLSTMTRTDLEQLVLQKLTEAIVHRSENAELRRIVKRQSAKLQGYERTIADMTNHYESLKLVAERAVIDMKKRANSFVAPVKITRAVGLQVSRSVSDGVSAHKLAVFSKLFSDKQKGETGVATVTTTTNGTVENGALISSSDAVAVAAVPFPGGHPQNTLANMNRSQFSNSMSPKAPRVMTTNPIANGMVRTINSQFVKHNNSVTAASLSITPGNAVRLTNDVSVVSTPVTATLASVSPIAGLAPSPNSVAVGGTESSVRKKFHKFTPKRPPLSPYQQAQQEKQVRQQQELLVQQIHEQSQQAQQRKAQISVHQDVLPAVETTSVVRTTAPTDAVPNNRQRSMPPMQSRVLNSANLQAPATQNYQLVSVGAIRPVASSTLTNSSTTLQVSEVQKANSHTSTVLSAAAAAGASPPVNGSLIDLTDEDDTTTSSIYIKRAKPSQGAPFSSSAASPSIPSSSVQAIASNQLVRIQQRINAGDGGGETVVSAVTTSSSVGAINQYNNSAMVRASLNVNRPNNASALQPIRQPTYNSNVQRIAASTDMLKKRVIIKPMLAPLPNPGPQPSDSSWKLPPPQPSICVNNVQAGIVISWTMPSFTKQHAAIETYQIYAYQELSVQSASEEWRHVGDVKALLLPMAVTLTQFHEGQRYYFAVRAIDSHKRVGKFCEPRTWNDANVAN